MVNFYKKNKKITSIFIATFLFIATSGVVLAGSAHLTWDANSDQDLAGYNVYYAIDSLPGGTCPSGYTKVDAGNVTSYWLDTLTPGHTYYFQLTAYDDSDNESTCSTDPSGATSKLITYRSDIASSTDSSPDHWVNIYDFNILFTNWGQINSGNIADFTRNNVVDSGDLTVMRNEFNQHF